MDENLPEALLGEFASVGHDVDNVRQENLAGAADSNIWRASQEAARFLITQDLDFSDIRKFMPGTHHGLMLVRLHVPGRLALTRRVLQVFSSEPVEEWKRCFVLVTDIKARVHRPE